MSFVGIIMCYNKDMAFKIERNDITKIHADAIVNTANPLPLIGKGTDASIYEAAGKDELLACRHKLGVIEQGHSVWTPSFKLKSNGVKYIIHTVGVPYKDGDHGEIETLRSCYSSALKTAVELKCKSVAIPLLASGNYSFPKDKALQIAIEEISRFLLENDILVCLVVYDNESYKISEKLFDDVEDFLCDNLEDEEDLEKNHAFTITGSSVLSSVNNSKALIYDGLKNRTKYHKRTEKNIEAIDVDSFIKSSKENLNFQNTLQQLIANRKVDNATIYKKACVDKKFFSKIISNKNYIPKKHTVMALGLALELPLVEYEAFLASAGYAFMPSSRFDMIIKFCVINQIYNIVSVDVILNDHGEECFAPL